MLCAEIVNFFIIVDSRCQVQVRLSMLRKLRVLKINFIFLKFPEMLRSNRKVWEFLNVSRNKVSITSLQYVLVSKENIKLCHVMSCMPVMFDWCLRFIMLSFYKRKKFLCFISNLFVWYLRKFLKRIKEKKRKNKAYYDDGLYAYIYLFIACHICISPK